MNPFTFGNPIKDRAHFFGRQAEIRQIVNRLLSSAHESTSIIGERRIGKTSLLNYLANPEVAAGLGLTPDKYCLVYVDFQGLTDITPARFWQRVLKKMAHSICDESLRPSIEKLSEQSAFDLFDLEDVFQTSMEKGHSIVLLMDEFEYVTENANFKNDFFGGLRALAIHSGVALVPATRRELLELCHSEEIKGSPFFNIFANVVLRPFNREQVDEMLAGYLGSSEQTLTPQEHDLIWGMAEGYPLFVQMAAYYLLEGKEQGLAAQPLTEFATSNFEEQASTHYAYIWSHCSENEKITLIMVITLGAQRQTKKTIPTQENLARLRARASQDVAALARRGLISDQNGSYKIYSSSFERWMRQEIMAAPGEEETQQSVDEWLKSGGRDEFKKANVVLPKFKKKYWPLLGDLLKDFSIEFAVVGTIELIKLLL